ncbi:unnamed protein product [Chrysoparadoxa australica]
MASLSSIMTLWKKVSPLEEDNRGTSQLCDGLEDELARAAEALAGGEKKIVIIMTGFPCLLDHEPPTETDGPPGAVAIARACIAFGHHVTIITDEVNEEVVMAAVAGAGLPGSALSLESFPANPNWDATAATALAKLGERAGAVVAIERAGPGADGLYYTMKKRDMSDITAPLEDLLKAAGKDTATIGIGDGGNEVGMGKVYDKVVASEIPHAADIACTISKSTLGSAQAQ